MCEIDKNLNSTLVLYCLCCSPYIAGEAVVTTDDGAILLWSADARWNTLFILKLYVLVCDYCTVYFVR